MVHNRRWSYLKTISFTIISNINSSHRGKDSEGLSFPPTRGSVSLQPRLSIGQSTADHFRQKRSTTVALVVSNTGQIWVYILLTTKTKRIKIMSNQRTNVDLLIRIRCFLCDAYRHPWAVVKESGQWVCRQCANYEWNYRLQYTVNNVQMMKNHVQPHLSLRIQRLSNSSIPWQIPEVILSMPSNSSCVNLPKNSSETCVPNSSANARALDLTVCPRPLQRNVNFCAPTSAAVSTPVATSVAVTTSVDKRPKNSDNVAGNANKFFLNDSVMGVFPYKSINILFSFCITCQMMSPLIPKSILILI